MVIVVDDEDRENEGDLTMAASKVTPEAINFMAKHGRGQICLSMTGQRLDELEIPLAVIANTTPFGTAFCVPIDAKRERDDRHFGGRSRRHGARGDRPGDDGRGSGAARVTCRRCGRAMAACWCAPGRPRRRWISRGLPGSSRPASSAKS